MPLHFAVQSSRMLETRDPWSRRKSILPAVMSDRSNYVGCIATWLSSARRLADLRFATDERPVDNPPWAPEASRREQPTVGRANPVYGAIVTHWSRDIMVNPLKLLSPCENLAFSHMITNHVITVAGDNATCIAYVQARHYLPNDTGDSMQTMFGYYTNRFVRTPARFVRTPAGWKIRACKLTLTWQTGNWGIFALASARLKAAEASKKS
jgi:SnoaL-like domain